MTVLKAVALAGSLTREAIPTKAVIIRRGANVPGGRQELPVNIKKVLSKQALDQELLASDILYVPESGVKRTLDTVINSLAYTATWHIPY
jgi:hypothetical protein